MYPITLTLLFVGVSAAATSTFTPISKKSSVVSTVSSTIPTKFATSTIPVIKPTTTSRATISSTSNIISPSQVAAVKSNLASYNSAVQPLTDAILAFTGSDVYTQANNIKAAKENWHKRANDLYITAQGLSSGSLLPASDSSSLAKSIAGDLTSKLVQEYQALSNKKSLLVKAGLLTYVQDCLNYQSSQLTQLGDTLGPHFQPADIATIQQAGATIRNALGSTIGAYYS